MAEGTSSTKTTPTKSTAAAKEKASDPVPSDLVGDRVAMLSLRADGTPDQTNPTMIGDPEQAAAATRKQFVEQAVSAVDNAERSGSAAEVVEVEQDPVVAELTAKHEAAAEQAAAAAEKAVQELKA